MTTGDQNPSAVITEDAPAGVVVREGEYGASLTTVEPGGAEFIPLHERHGRPIQLFWTWTSPNLEFATVFVGVLAVAAFGLSFWQAVLAIVIGTGVRRDHPGHPVGARPLPRRAADGAVPARLRLLGQRVPGRAELDHRGHRLVRREQRQRHVRPEHAHAPAQAPLPADHRRGAGGDRVLRPQPRAALRALRVPGARGHLRDRDHRHPVQVQPRRTLPRRRVRAGSCSRPARCSATRSAGTPTPPTTPATSRPTPARRRSRSGPVWACSCPARSWRSPAPRRPRSPAWAPHSATPPAPSPATCPPCSPTSPCWPSRSARSRRTC